MKAIEAKINGKTICQAGLPEKGNLAAILNLVALKPKRGSARREKNWETGFRLGGLSVEGDDYRFLEFATRVIRDGDEITLRVIDVAKSSPPRSERVETKAERLKSQRRYVKHMGRVLRTKR